MYALPFADPGVPDTRTPGAFMRWVAARQARTLAAGAVLGTGWMVGQALLPFALGHAIDAGVARHDATRLLTWTLVVLALGATVAGAGVGRHRFAVTNFLIASTRTSQLVSRQVSHLGAQTRERWSTGEVATIANADVASVARLFDITARLAGALIALVLIGVLLLVGSVSLGILVLIGMPLVLVALSLLVRPLERREAQTRALLGESSALAADTVLGLRVLRGVGGEAVFFARFAAASQRVRRAGVRAALIQSVLDALQVLLPGLFVVLVTWLGARAALEHKISAGQLVSYYGYTAFLVAPLQVFTEAAKKGAASYAAARRLVGLLAAERGQPDPAGPAPVLDPGGDLRDRDSGLVVAAGLLTGIVCADPDAGHALADRLGGWAAPAAELGGVALDTVASATVRACVLVADRDPVLLAGTLRDTLDVPAGVRPPTRDEALAVADGADIVDSLADGVDGELAERGRNLSGGQRQRVALARALRAAAPVLVLDEPTSAVDAHTEARIGSRLRAARAGRTTVLITTSPLLLEATDQVIWLPAEGTPVRDSHARLLGDAHYRRTVLRSQDVDLDLGLPR